MLLVKNLQKTHKESEGNEELETLSTFDYGISVKTGQVKLSGFFMPTELHRLHPCPSNPFYEPLNPFKWWPFYTLPIAICQTDVRRV